MSDLSKSIFRLAYELFAYHIEKAMGEGAVPSVTIIMRQLLLII
jgi:hypothetical protein